MLFDKITYHGTVLTTYFFHQYRHVRVCGDAASRGGAFGATEGRAGGDGGVYGVCSFVVCTYGGADVEGSVEEGKDGGEEWAYGGGGACLSTLRHDFSMRETRGMKRT